MICKQCKEKFNVTAVVAGIRIGGNLAAARVQGFCSTECEMLYTDKYQELLQAVTSKYAGESRHETALRYIRECECFEAIKEKEKETNNGTYNIKR